jgi:hypothetical protein
VIDLAREDIGDGLDAAMRVRGKSPRMACGIVVAEIVEEPERVKLGGIAKAEGAAQVHARTFHRGGRGAGL